MRRHYPDGGAVGAGASSPSGRIGRSSSLQAPAISGVAGTDCSLAGRSTHHRWPTCFHTDRASRPAGKNLSPQGPALCPPPPSARAFTQGPALCPPPPSARAFTRLPGAGRGATYTDACRHGGESSCTCRVEAFRRNQRSRSTTRHGPRLHVWLPGMTRIRGIPDAGCLTLWQGREAGGRAWLLHRRHHSVRDLLGIDPHASAAEQSGLSPAV
jgi:hypothetical protein